MGLRKQAGMGGVWAAVVLGLMAGACAAGAGCRGDSPGPVQDVGPVDVWDAAVRDAARDATTPDAGPDAAFCEHYGPVRPLPWPPEATDYDFCDQVFFKLPLDMWSQGSMSYVRLSEGRVVYKAWDASMSPFTTHLYYFDLEACRQYLVAWQFPQDAVMHDLWGKTLAAQWALPCPEDGGAYFFLVDLETWDVRQVTWDERDVAAGTGAFNGRYLGASKALMRADGGVDRLTTVLDVETGEEEMVADGRAYPDYMSATEHFITWIEYGDRGFGRWAAWYDPVTKEKHVIEETVADYQEYVSSWGTKIVGHWGEIYQQGPYHLWVYDVAESEFRDVVVERATPFASVWGNVLVMNTVKYITDPQGVYPHDIMLLDLETGVERRVTRQPGYVFLPDGFEPPWLVIGVYGGWPRHTYWALNVYEAGLIDADGHVIPGDPVIDPPTPDD